jgi:putative tryptophan/tyrosine transport system substrate-binding protein
VTTRRAFLAILTGGVLAGPVATGAQPAAKTVRVGCLEIGGDNPRNWEAFLQGLRDLGYVEDRNLQVDYRDAKGKPDRFPALAAELVALKVDVIVTFGGTLAALAAKRATTTIPIVFHVVGDPVADGLVASLAQPRGNVTGFSNLHPELVGKLFELLRQAVPGVRRVAFLLKPDAAPERTMQRFRTEADVAAQALGIQLEVVEARGPGDFDRAFQEMSRARAGGLVVLNTPIFGTHRRRLADLAAKNRLPTVISGKVFVEAGGLISYGPDFVDLARRAATYVDKIVKGARPADLPVEQPTKFELVINLKTAKALGLTIPQLLLSRADEVIQ